MLRVFFISLLLLSFYSSAFELYLVRHFEKASQRPDPPLTEKGALRAEQFALQMKSADISKVYSSDYQRTRMTATPLAKSKGLAVQLYDPERLAEFARQLLEQQQSSVIVGHSNTTPELIRMLGGIAKPIAEDQYGDVYLLRFSTKIKQSHFKVGLP